MTRNAHAGPPHHRDIPAHPLPRRALLGGAFGLFGLAATPGWARTHSGGVAEGGAGGSVLTGDHIALTLAHAPFSVGGRRGHAMTVNGQVPGPLIRLREGQTARISVTNNLGEESSIHWHGVLLPFTMDGVPGISFPGIAPGARFDYEFLVRQSGTYWYHSHSGMQEGMGLYGAIVIDPAAPEPIHVDREHILVLADWSFTHPHQLMRRLKQAPGYYNRQKQTIAGLLAGRDQPLADRLHWGKMLMDPTDLADVTGATYHYLVNGHDLAGNWTGLFTPGEQVRLRIINASAMTNFNLRIPGLAMTVVSADGLAVRPVETDEFQIAVAETYDVLVSPIEARAYGVIAEAIDRSGLVRASLSPAVGMVAPVPPLRARPLLTMKDMGMDTMADSAPDPGAAHPSSATDHSSMDHGAMGHDMMDHDAQKAEPTRREAMDRGAMNHGAVSMRDPVHAPGVHMGPGVATIAPHPVDRLADRPTGLEAEPHRVLTYAQLRSAQPRPVRAPDRAIELHLTGNMERYMWSFDGLAFSQNPDPIALRLGECVRMTLINDTMMPHPIHLHGHFFALVSGDAADRPLKHTVNVLPGGIVAFDVIADAPGDWAFHCHMLLHMHAGMFRVVTVRPDTHPVDDAALGPHREHPTPEPAS